ncbi:hypothetical protein DB44_FV00060 [Candidatus Protochlamydia amoebophila]|uniref:Uncharacterized protein n=1 Tax=Candidatus Protochlamydia amoebophila TaxID=362787 RepID=A0A0C1GYX7_9BACT|nr:hypothetical protein DB44_FV00060 [Candidatus Protochlamydia amoebophila]
MDNAYFVAKKLGYLQDYSQKVAIDILILNEQKYLSSEMNSTKEKQNK